MSGEDFILKSLEEIVGREFVSNRIEERYLYSKDPGATKSCMPDYVVLPNSTEQIQAIIKLANEKKIGVIPFAGGLTTAGLSVPSRGGIIIDFQRMNKILELNETSGYVIIEPGVTQGQLKTYLDENTANRLQHSIPGAPPSASVIGNLMIYGAGHLCNKYGFNHTMCNGIEVVRPDGDVYRLGSCAVTDKWFAIPPMPDLSSLFLNGWFGTTGIITKLSLQLFPNPAFKDVLIYVGNNIDDSVDLMHAIAMREICEDIIIMGSGMLGNMIVNAFNISGHIQEEINFKKKMIVDLIDEFGKKPNPKTGKKRRIRPMKGFPLKDTFLISPPPIARLFVFQGGSEYLGGYIPFESIIEVFKGGREICKKYGLTKEIYLIRPISLYHTVMYALVYPFNRTSEEERKTVENELIDTTKLILKVGGIPWKPDRVSQKVILEQTDPKYQKLMKEVKKLLDPNNIMNPGNWE